MLASTLIAVGGLWACASVTPYDPPPVYPPAGPEAVREVHDLIRSIEKLPRFTKEIIEETLAVKLKPTEPIPDPSYLNGQIPRGTFSDVLYREIRPVNGPPRWLVSVSVRRGVAIPFASIDRQFVGSRGTAGDGPYESISTWSMDRPGGILHLRYGNSSRTLQDIIIVREGSPERGEVEAAFVKAKAGATEIESFIQRFDSIPTFSRRRVESLMGLVLAPKSAPSNVQSWEAQAAGSRILSRVSYEESNHYGLMTSTVTLFVKSDVALPSRYLNPSTMGPFIDRIEMGSPEPIRTRSVDRPGASLRLGVGQSSDHVRMVVFVRERYLARAKKPAPR